MKDADNFQGNPFADEDNFKGDPFAAAPAPTPMKSGYYNAAPGEEVGPVMQFLGGAKHAWDRAAAGLQSTAGAFGLPTGESLQPLVRQGTQFVKETGPASTVGQIAGDVAMTAAPAVRLFKAVNAARGIKSAVAVEAGLNAGYGALTADQGKGAEGAAWGAGGTLAGHSMLPLARLAGGGAANVLGMTTGAGGESVKQAFKGGPEFVANMRGQVPADVVVDQARAGIGNIRRQMNETYKADKALWASGQNKMEIGPIASEYQRMIGDIQKEGFSRIGPDELRVINEANDVITEFGGIPSLHTAEGFDMLKQRLNAIYPASPMHRQAQRFVSTAADMVKREIIKQNPDYATGMRKYHETSDLLNEIEKTLSLGNKTMTDTALRKLQSLMRNNVNSNFGQRVALAKELEQQGGVNVMPAVAGQALNSWTPRGIQQAIAGGAGTMGLVSGVINPLQAGAAAAVQSPRLVGEGANKIGDLWKWLQAEAAMKALRHGTGPAAVAGNNSNE